MSRIKDAHSCSRLAPAETKARFKVLIRSESSGRILPSSLDFEGRLFPCECVRRHLAEQFETPAFVLWKGSSDCLTGNGILVEHQVF